MKRSLILTVLGAVLLVVLYGVLLFKPAREDLAALQQEVVSLEQQEVLLTAQLEKLAATRRAAPELEAELIAARVVVPEEAGVSAVVRQLQSAADEAGLELTSLSPSRPQPTTPEAGPLSLARIPIAMDVKGSYFQVVDFLRRLENPNISPRGFIFNSMSLAVGDEWPQLQVTFQGEAFALVEIAGAEPPPPVAPAPDGLGQDLETGLDVIEGGHLDDLPEAAGADNS
ncbi:MAG: type 4a pilus biogenesis protein PilO [Actinobacteria bacterium]|jgi:Tfp pilus assembly protein PilO|nr:type 4a pilus biogenesis protein PilO [Actinomycetota bacterium]